MKKIIILFLIIGFVLGIALPALATHDQTSPGDTAGGIANSRHNLSSTGIHFTTSATSEVCVFCHTPHFARSGADIYAPLWNKGYTAAGYTLYQSWLAGGGSANLGYSLACLSCHDGVGTFDNIINAPGKNGVNQSGEDLGWLFAKYGGSPAAENDNLGNETRVNIGTDLTNDHPIGIFYPLVGDSPVRSLRPRSTIIANINLSTLATSNPSNYWAVNGYINTTATIEGLLKAGSAGDAASGFFDYVECSSCHDPHYKNRTNPEIDGTYGATTHPTEINCFYGTDEDACGREIDGLFLRRVGGNSVAGVCRTCHDK